MQSQLAPLPVYRTRTRNHDITLPICYHQGLPSVQFCLLYTSENANLGGSILTYAILSEANLHGLNLADAVLSNLIISDQHWLKRLEDWQVNGAFEIQRKYKMIEAYSYENSKYQLIKTGN